MLKNLSLFQDDVRNDVLSGVTVALALVPEAVAFAFVAGVSPIIGLYSAFFIGLFAAVFGGRPGMISGATGAMAVVVVTLVAEHGLSCLFPAVILAGLIQILVGLCGLGKLIRMVPHPVELGFVNGLALVIFMAQFGSFQALDMSGRMSTISGPSLWIMLAMISVTMLIIWLLPKFTRAIPASLAAILAMTVVSVALNSQLNTPEAVGSRSNVVLTVRDMLVSKAASVSLAENVTVHGGVSEAAVVAALATAEETVGLGAGLPRPFFLDVSLPSLSPATLWLILPYSLTLAAVGLIESLMTLSLIDDITRTRGSGNRECIGQGVANIVCGFFGGMGGCAMIGQSLININSGGRGRLSGIVAAVCLLLFILFLAPWIEMIPMAALVGVMFMVVIATFEWASLRMLRRIPGSDYLVMLIVAGYTVVMHDLATAVVLGLITSALVFVWNQAR
ncbi:MAG: SulP family inorganic anion transporter, partial [Planctomycetaceae bacterium]